MLSTVAKTVGIALLGVVLGGTAVAQTTFPSKPVKIVVPFTAGSQVDIVARELGRALQDTWGQPVIVENRPGAGGTDLSVKCLQNRRHPRASDLSVLVR